MRRTLGALLAGVAAAGVVLASATAAAAHSSVVSSTPAEGESLTELPAAWELVANENLLYVGNDEVFGLVVRDAEGLYYGDGCVDVTGARMTAESVIGEPGDYTLVFAFISADGHPLTGEIPFTWAPAGEFTAATGATEVPRCGAAVDEPAGSEQPSAGTGIPGDVGWIVGAVLAVVAAIVVALALGRRPRS